MKWDLWSHTSGTFTPVRHIDVMRIIGVSLIVSESLT